MRLLLAVFLGLSWVATAFAESLRIAVASNFLLPAKVLVERYEQSRGKEVILSAGSTGKLYAQIINGAPYGAFLAANVSEPRRLETMGLAVSGSRFTYAIGRLVLWSPGLGRMTEDDGGNLIRDGEFTRLAIANPKTAPYGLAAVQTMRVLGLNPETLGPRLVRGENLSQVYQFIASGNADLGFVALSQVSNPERPSTGSRWLVPAELHEPIEQQAVLLARSDDTASAQLFLDYLKGPESRELIARYGYGTP